MTPGYQVKYNTQTQNDLNSNTGLLGELLQPKVRYL